MNTLLAFSSIIFGLLLLTYGGNILVDGAVSLAKRFGISEAIIGLTIVAIGTSMPELVVSVLASISGNTEIAIGNVLGSNIANVFFILGLTAVISPIVLTRTTRFFDLPIVLLTSVLLLILVSDIFLDGARQNTIGRIDGLVLISVAIAYILYSVKHNNFIPDESSEVIRSIPFWKSILWIILAVVLLFSGGKILVDGAVDIARSFQVSESIIGLTIVAVGTSMPELVTSIVAARRGNPDIAVGNVIGSNIMNILVILSVSSIIAPLPFLSTSFVDLILVMSAPIILLLLSFVWTRNMLGEKEGYLLVSMYLLYILYLLAHEMQ